MQKSLWVVAIRVISVAALGMALLSQGALAAQRTFVASYGNDAANLTAGCTLVLPCRSNS